MTSPAFTRIESDANARFKRWKKLALESRSVKKEGSDNSFSECDTPSLSDTQRPFPHKLLLSFVYSPFLPFSPPTDLFCFVHSSTK